MGIRAAALSDLLQAPMEWLGLARWRRRLWARLMGARVLEVGVGTGRNVPYYPHDAAITAVDVSPHMLARAQNRSRRLGVAVDLRLMDVENLEFAGGTFDSVVASFVFCSVADPLKGLHEVARVTKPDGFIFLLEHVRPPSVFGMLADLFNPLALRVGGPNINRRTVENVREAGLVVERVEDLWDGVVKLIIARPGKGTISTASVS